MSAEASLAVAIRGTRGRYEPRPGDREFIDAPTRTIIRELVAQSGAKPGPAQVYIAKRIRYHLGAGNPPAPPRELDGLAEWADRRAWDLVDQARRRLPPIRNETEPR
jgi:hypothetical protein